MTSEVRGKAKGVGCKPEHLLPYTLYLPPYTLKNYVQKIRVANYCKGNGTLHYTGYYCFFCGKRQ